MKSNRQQPTGSRTRAVDRRRFLAAGLGIGAAVGAAPALARASTSALGWRDQWVYRRLAARVPRPASGVEATATADALVLRRGDGEWSLNHTAAEVWQRADGTRSVARIAAEVAQAYGVPRARVAGDVAVAVRQLLRQGCLIA